MSIFAGEINSFYYENKEDLEKFYPGIRISHFSEHIEKAVLRSGPDPKLTDLDPIFHECLKGKPLEYITNEKYFYRSSFFVDERVLIPRAETEILVEDSIEFIKERSSKSLAEIGVGSGAISISIAKECPDLKIWAGDISKKALEVCRHNISNYKVSFAPGTEIELKKSDRLKKAESSFDCIVSNPPYIKMSDTVHEKVLEYEPKEALFLNDQEYQDWFEQLFKQVHSCLNENGMFLMEGHEDHLEELKKLAEKYFKEVSLKKDYTQRLRFLYAKK